ncbi:MerR family transcriptional regulator [Micromonospora sp. WMMD975]|uniref:MerR family transcriptional regulator n=1 Tax=Micromonospora sp. WMMD975 TaxID=3016087 RepID=UPI00249A181B|nr:MerR family transcriptional regulator [Micromonospora sp. WMMD975]WFE31196.1 MerR family transcriptional regulator [Micromonospora sp. WMMD975]
MRIGEVARAMGCTPRALRHYEERGLIVSTRAMNGYREYDPAVVTRVRNIRHLLDAGLTLDDVRVFLPCLDGDVAAAPPSPAGLKVGRDRLAVLNARIAAQITVRDRLAAALHAAAPPPPSPVPGR